MKKISLVLSLLVALVVLMFWMPKADAFSSYYTANCRACHGTTSTCNGCHAHGVHSGNAKDDINVTGMTNKTTYAPGEMVSVTINGGYRTGWIRAILYDQNMVELARSTGTIVPPATAPCCGAGYPITLTAPAPATPGTYIWNVSWYGHQFDLAEVDPTVPTFFGPRWTPDPNNLYHGQEIVSTNSFMVAVPPTPVISLNPASLNFGTVTIGGSATLSTMVQNLGTADLTVTGIARCAGTSTEYTWMAVTPFTVAPGASVPLPATYMPVDTGTDAGCLQIVSNDPVTPTATLNLTGTGASPQVPVISLNPASLNFGTVTIGGSATLSTMVQNLGTADLIVTGIALCTGTSTEYTWTAVTPFTVAPGASAPLPVTYMPIDTGTDAGCLHIASNDPLTSTATLNLTGTGTAVPQPKINLNPASLNFGVVTVGGSATLSTMVQNVGTADLIVTGIALCTGTSTEYTWTAVTPFTVAPGASAPLPVTYMPIDTGTDAGCLHIASNDPLTSTATLNLTGTGTAVPQPKINLNPASLNFGTVTIGGSATLSTMVQNLGDADLTVTGIARCAGTSTEYTWMAVTPFTVAPGGSAPLPVTYMPVDTGTDTGCLHIASNDLVTPTATLNLTGTGSQPGAVDLDIVKFWATPQKVNLFNDKSKDNSEHGMAHTVKLRLIVMNKGTVGGSAPATLVGTQGGVEVYNQTITVSAPAGGSATFTFPPYAPTAPGDINWTLTISDPTPDTATATTVVVP